MNTITRSLSPRAPAAPCPAAAALRAAAAARPPRRAPAGSPAPDVTEVTLIMDWVPWVLDIPVDVAQDKGFYAA